MNRPSNSFVRPVVFISGAIIALSLCMLCYAEYCREIMCFAAISAVFLFAVLFYFKNRAAAFVLSVMLVLGAVCPYAAYISKEKYAFTVLEILGEKEYTFSGKVTYSSASSRPVNLRVNVTEINGRKVKKPFSVRATSFSGDNMNVGDSLVFKGVISGLNEAENGEFDTKTYLRSKNTFLRVENAEFVSSAHADSKKLLSKLRTHYENAVYRYVRRGYTYTSPAIVKALTLGDKTSFSKQMTQSFSQSGLSHLMCVSGMHLSVLLGMIAASMKALTLHKRTRCLLLCGFCIFYIIFTGGSASVIRAGIMAVFTYSAQLFGRKSDSVAALFFSGAAMVLANPYVVLDISARLSFAATLGVILMGNVTKEMFSGIHEKHPVIYGLICAVFVNVGAVMLTLPLSADSFGGFSTVSIPATLCTSLVCEMLIILSNILCLLSFLPLPDFVCTSVGQVCGLFSEYIMNMSDFFSSLPYSYVKSHDIQVIFISSMVFISLLSLFLTFGAKKLTRLALFAIVALSLTMGVLGIRDAFIQDGELRVSYYRKNKDDRQLCAKLGRKGYIIFNADDLLCTNPDKADFDTLSGKNHLVLIPNENNDIYILSESIHEFSSRYGLKGVLVPGNENGYLLAHELSSYGINCHVFPNNFSTDNFSLSFDCGKTNTYSLSAYDGKDEVFAVFADKYAKEAFDGHTDICAYFTRETKTQFNPETDIMPECTLFVARAGKEQAADGMLNTYGQTSFVLKE